MEQAGLKSGSKIMVIGSAPKDALKASAGQQQAADKGMDWDAPKAVECWSESDQHKKASSIWPSPLANWVVT